MSDLECKPARLQAVIQVTRAATGIVETYTLTEIQPPPESQDGSFQPDADTEYDL